MASDRFTGMETFASVVEVGSYSRAARILRIGRPSVSKSIALLDRRLGVRLVFRTTRGLAATDGRQRFYERAELAIDEAN